ncbi:MAG: hypothetical protein K6F77_04425 [Lachnospiraceae bacterium]|nr:hypothetical protein [Lachnospiraceae bacterium]
MNDREKDFIELVGLLNAGNVNDAISVYEKEYNDNNIYSFFNKLFKIVEKSSRAYVILLMLSVCKKHMFKAAFTELSEVYVDKEVERKLFDIILKDGKYEAVETLSPDYDVDIYEEELIRNGISKDQLLLRINSKKSIIHYVESYIGNNADKLFVFLKENKQLECRTYIKLCMEGIKMSSFRTMDFINLLDTCYRENKINNICMSSKETIELAILMPSSEERLFRNMVEQYGRNIYKLEISKRYPQSEIPQNYANLISNMVDAQMSTERFIFVFMNSKLRSNVNLDYLIMFMENSGYRLEKIMDELRDYWFVGRVMHIQENGRVRIAPGSVGNSRLMTFNYNRIHVNGKDGWEKPVEGSTLYYRIRDYKEGGLFTIHYPCTDISYINT